MSGVGMGLSGVGSEWSQGGSGQVYVGESEWNGGGGRSDRGSTWVRVGGAQWGRGCGAEWSKV